MRRFLTVLILTILSVGVLEIPRAHASGDGTRMTIPLSYPVDGINPCTGEPVTHHLSGELQIHALPTVGALFNGGVTHATLKWVMAATTSDGYSAPLQHFATFILNDRDGDNDGHVVVTETNNWMFSNDDGSRIKLDYRHHVTVIDGEPTVFTEVGDLRCVHHPTD